MKFWRTFSPFISFKAEEKGLELLFRIGADVPHHLVGDPLRLGQVLINLANNAVKFTESGEIAIAIDLAGDGDLVTLHFSVHDTGIGLSGDEISKLFQSFSQADSSVTRKHGGTGLGLIICQRLVEMMGGTMEVESEPGRGSSFGFTATFGRTRQEQSLPLRIPSELRGMRVLVVDDNWEARDILREILESFSFEVCLAASGEEGLAEVEKATGHNHFGLVIMDYKMPGIDGLEAARLIKGHPDLSNPPAIILVTGIGESVMPQEGRLRIDGVLRKPVRPSGLFDAVLRVLNGKEAEDAAAIPQPEQVAGMADPIRGARILLVEDNEINQQVAQELLESEGLSVSLANNGLEALQSVEAFAFDAVLMDVQMPVMDGFQATRRIRSLEGQRFHDLPIIAMTAHAMSGDREKSLEVGMNDHLPKPIDPIGLFATLVQWIKP